MPAGMSQGAGVSAHLRWISTQNSNTLILMKANEAKKDGVKQVRCQNVHKSLSIAQMMQSSVAAAGLPRGSPLRPGCSRDRSALTANVGVWAAIVGDGNGLRTKSTMLESKSKSPSAAGEQLSKEGSEIWVVLMHTLHPFGGRG